MALTREKEMKKTIFILGILLIFIILLFYITQKYEEKKRSAKLEQLQEELSQIKKLRNEAIDKAGKDIEKIIILDNFFNELIKRKEREIKPYEKREKDKDSPKEYLPSPEFAR